MDTPPPLESLDLFESMPSLKLHAANFASRGIYHTRAYDRLTRYLWDKGSPRQRQELFKLLTAIHQICAYGYLSGGVPPNKTEVRKLGAAMFGECERTIETKFIARMITDHGLLITIKRGNCERVVLTEKGDKLVTEYLRLLHFHHQEMNLVDQYADIFENTEQRLRYRALYSDAVKMDSATILKEVDGR